MMAGGKELYLRTAEKGVSPGIVKVGPLADC